MYSRVVALLVCILAAHNCQEPQCEESDADIVLDPPADTFNPYIPAGATQHFTCASEDKAVVLVEWEIRVGENLFSYRESDTDILKRNGVSLERIARNVSVLTLDTDTGGGNVTSVICRTVIDRKVCFTTVEVFIFGKGILKQQDYIVSPPSLYSNMFGIFVKSTKDSVLATAMYTYSYLPTSERLLPHTMLSPPTATLWWPPAMW